MRHPRTTVALAAAGALGLAAVPVIAQEVVDGPDAATAPSDDSSSSHDRTNDVTPDGEVVPDADRAPRAGGERHHGRFGPKVEQLSDDFAEELADELGLEPDEVADAIDRVRERWESEFAATLDEHRAELAERMDDRLDDAVAEGALTQEQADALADLFTGAERPGPGMLDDLTDEQRGALEDLREWAGEHFGEHGWGGRGGPGGHGGPGGGFGGPDDDQTDDDSSEGASDAPTVQESMLQVT